MHQENTTLIISSDKKYRQLLLSFLTHIDNIGNILECEDKNDAFIKIQKLSPSLVFIEHSTPDSDTIELINIIRNILHYSVPMIIFTSVGNEEFAIESMLAGANDYLIKEKINKKMLKSRVKKVFAAYSAIKKTKDDLKKYKQLYLFDELTHLYNRSGLNKYLSKELAYAIRHNIPLACFYLDIDGFKTINDSLGHAAGDYVLEETGKRLQLSMREEDIISRYGGDEFVIICIGLSDKVKTIALANKILNILKKPFVSKEGEALLSASIGIAFSHKKSTISSLIDEADQALKKSKKEKGVYTIFKR